MSLFEKEVKIDEELVDNVVSTYERNVDKYKGKSLTWYVRITADELGIKKDLLCDILDEYYDSDEKAED